MAHIISHPPEQDPFAPPAPAGLAPLAFRAVARRRPPHHRCQPHRMVAEDPRVLRARLSRRRRLHGPGQLGHGHRRRRALRLRAALASCSSPTSWRSSCRRSRSSSASPPAATSRRRAATLLAPGLDRALDRLRNRHRRVRPRRSHRLRHRAETALQYSAHVRRHHHGRRRARRAHPPAPRLPPARSGRHHAHRDDRRLLPVRDGDLASPNSAPSRSGFLPAKSILHGPRAALHRHRHPRRHGDAAQSVPALVHRADAAIRGDVGRQARSDPLRARSIRRSR